VIFVISTENIFCGYSYPSSCGCEILSVTLKEEHRLRMFENRALKKIFGPNRDEQGQR
jgi:hypothetical protein